MVKEFFSDHFSGMMYLQQVLSKTEKNFFSETSKKSCIVLTTISSPNYPISFLAGTQIDPIDSARCPSMELRLKQGALASMLWCIGEL